MPRDRSEGWNDVADQYLAARSSIGATLVRAWARENLPPSASVLDVGCGSGVPIAQVLIEDGFNVFGIDASPNLVAAFHARFPDMPVACEAAQESVFFCRPFGGAVSIGLIFLLDEDDQREVLRRIADALEPGGRLLFSAPREICQWDDLLTCRTSRSLGEDAYVAHLQTLGLHVVGCLNDEGGNNYFDVVKNALRVGPP
ncbi:class I SAM-dependent methyltransferase [Luteibacter sp. UNCMF366Tsu5.1]|uniref:class I SAM-dependent methyltransferase n=1 Tax=Luteibacter sp. UNCMF366Tsu5.1 TaxID=1502758 RepID=UPI000908EAF7|nr:class I SAM-dependent methyltransferase [Luteibacter sp. UNCMF366Tsu5.1]SFW29472.1 Methyltransferase domain-containing protein [Luteibacter sp. UNCMF366Tsu5.1]